MFENYIKFVEDTIKKYSEESRLIYDNEVTPDQINLALANYLETNLALIGEYQRAKVNKMIVEDQYEQWYDQAFIDTRAKLIDDNEAKSAKISVKEIETDLRVTYKKDYYDWQDKLKEADVKVSYLRRLVDIYKKYDQILTTISQNMRGELHSLSLPNRMNKDPENKRLRVRTQFPEAPSKSYLDELEEGPLD